MMRLTIDRDRCVASGQCVMLAPDVFDQGDDGIVILLTDSVEGDSQNIVDSIRICPSAAINLVD